MLGPSAPLVATLSQGFANIGQGTTSGRLSHISPSRETPTSVLQTSFQHMKSLAKVCGYLLGGAIVGATIVGFAGGTLGVGVGIGLVIGAAAYGVSKWLDMRFPDVEESDDYSIDSQSYDEYEAYEEASFDEMDSLLETQYVDAYSDKKGSTVKRSGSNNDVTVATTPLSDASVISEELEHFERY